MIGTNNRINLKSMAKVSQLWERGLGPLGDSGFTHTHTHTHKGWLQSSGTLGPLGDLRHTCIYTKVISNSGRSKRICLPYCRNLFNLNF